MPGILAVELAATLLPLVGFHLWSNVGVDEALLLLLSDPIPAKDN